MHANAVQLLHCHESVVEEDVRELVQPCRYESGTASDESYMDESYMVGASTDQHPTSMGTR